MYNGFRRNKTIGLDNWIIGFFFFDMLHIFFLSAKNEKERLMRLKGFVTGLYQSKSNDEIDSYKHLTAVVDGLFELLEYAVEVRVLNHRTFIK